MNLRCFSARVCSMIGKSLYKSCNVSEQNQYFFFFFFQNQYFYIFIWLSPPHAIAWLAVSLSAFQSVSSIFQRQHLFGSLLFPHHRRLVIVEILSGELSKCRLWQSIGGSVVEFSPPTRETRVQFPANAGCPSTFHTSSLFCLVHSQVRILRGSGHQEQEKENWKPRGGSEQKTVRRWGQLGLCKALRYLGIWSSIWWLAAQQLPRWWVPTCQCVGVSVGLRFRIFGLVTFQFFSQKVLATQRAIRSLIHTLEHGLTNGPQPTRERESRQQLRSRSTPQCPGRRQRPKVEGNLRGGIALTWAEMRRRGLAQ